MTNCRIYTSPRINKVVDNSSYFEETKAFYFCVANSGFDPNNPFKDYAKYKSKKVWISTNFRTWIELKSIDYLHKSGNYFINVKSI